MAMFDKTAGEIVVRIVYAGPPLAGKTETVRVLAKMLLGDRASSEIYSPSEAQGRTLYFDWVSYVGGSFKGNKVRCQIISVPGQDVLVERRRYLLEQADAVVLVIDSTGQGLKQAEHYFQEMLPWISKPEDELPIGIILQANKRDLPDALPGAQIKSKFNDYPKLTVFETTATAGTGIREAFVMSVGQALARVGNLMNSNRLVVGTPEITSGDDLLAQIEALEKLDQPASQTTTDRSALNDIDTPRSDTKPSLLARVLIKSINTEQNNRSSASPQHTETSTIPVSEMKKTGTHEQPERVAALVSEVSETVKQAAEQPDTVTIRAQTASSAEPTSIQQPDLESEPATADPLPVETATAAITAAAAEKISPPVLPDRNLHAGTVWPPVAGRLTLYEISDYPGVPEQQTDGSWWYAAGNWRLQSRAEYEFETAAEALRTLLMHANQHKALEPVISPNRCLALVPINGKGRRMWEIVRAEKNLAQALDNALNKTQSPLILANEVVEIAAFLVRAVRAFQQYTIPLEIRLDSIGQIAKQPVYLGFLSCDNSAVQTGTNTDSDIDLLIRSQFGGPISRALIKQNINVPHILRAMQHLKNTDAVESATIETLSALFIGQ